MLALIGHVAATTPTTAVAITLCTGTRDPDNQWRRHPANDEPEAWRDLVDALDELLPHAEHSGVILGIEPEPGDVVADAIRGAQLMNEMRAGRGTLGIVLDPANLVQGHPADQAKRIIARAGELLGDEVICLHAKDVTPGVAAETARWTTRWSELVHPRCPVPVIPQDVSEFRRSATRITLGAIADRHPWRGR